MDKRAHEEKRLVDDSKVQPDMGSVSNDTARFVDTSVKFEDVKQEEDPGKNTNVSKNVFGILAFFLGALGIHDFAMGRYLYGCGHLALVVVAITIFSFNHNGVLPPSLALGSWVWAIRENVIYQKYGENTITEKNQMRSFLAIAIVAEVITMLVIVLSIIAMVTVLQFRNCYTAGCDGIGWTIVLEVWIGLPAILMMIFLINTALMQRKKYLTLYGSNKIIQYHTIILGILSVVLIIAIIIIILLALRVL